MSEPIWPIFEKHEDVTCYKCGKKIVDNVRAHGSATFPAGHGQYNKRCPDCLVSTWYDIGVVT